MTSLGGPKTCQALMPNRYQAHKRKACTRTLPREPHQLVRKVKEKLARTAYRHVPASMAGGSVASSVMLTAHATGVGRAPWTSHARPRPSHINAPYRLWVTAGCPCPGHEDTSKDLMARTAPYTALPDDTEHTVCCHGIPRVASRCSCASQARQLWVQPTVGGDASRP